ncbi:acylneuraminate cytidylyltransferase family protein [Algoriphagus oliviformis]|uniref:acylneuraminate cytidylyltransferase family protein n=1 Tax=Algoriphagus oliviformis TaxID=2811231 RepID=UPI001F29A2C7|nr:acylneuraminate cytidylyltransferase family protein [Algoriphagus oliviformis]
MSKLKILGIIPARSGSKGIPGKNTKLLNGLPLIGYVARDAKESLLLDSVIVSTDSAEIGRIAEGLGLDFPFLRPDEISGDKSPSIDFVKHAILALAEQGKHYDAICLLQPTSPFKPKGFIDACIRRFVDGDFDSLVSVLEVPHEFNPHWVFEESADGLLKIATGEEQLIPRRQDLPKAYYRDGSVYLAKTDLILKESRLVGGKLGYVLSDESFYCNLDTMKDWYLAEEKVKSL